MKIFMIKPIVVLTALTLGVAAIAQNQPQPAPEPNQPADATAQPQPVETLPQLQPQNGGGESNAIPAEAVGELIQSVIEARDALNNQGTSEGEKKTDESGSRRIRGQGTRGTMGSGTNAV